MTPNPFSAELRTLAAVPRWCIVMTTMKDTVATHSFYVTVYSYLIAETIGWKGPRDYLMFNALMHDHDESITGDITGPVKSIVVDKESEQFLHEKSLERMGGLLDVYYNLEDKCSDADVREASMITLAADKLDALLFLIINLRMGNTMVRPAIDGGQKSLEGTWRGLPAAKDVLDRTWQTVILPAIKDHHERGGRGCAPGVCI